MGKQKPPDAGREQYLDYYARTLKRIAFILCTWMWWSYDQSSVIHWFVPKNTTEQSPSTLLYPWQQSMPQSQQAFRKFNGSIFVWPQQPHHMLILSIPPLPISRQRSKIGLSFATDQLYFRVAGLLLSQLPGKATEHFVPSPSEGIHERCWWCWSSSWTLRLHVCWCNVPDMYSIYGMEMKPAVVTLVWDVSAADEENVDNKK